MPQKDTQDSILAQNVNPAQMEILQNIEKQKIEQEQKFIQRMESFKNFKTIDEAKEFAKKFLPVASEVNRFQVGNAKCIVINKEDMFRISFDSEHDFISYDFSN